MKLFLKKQKQFNIFVVNFQWVVLAVNESCIVLAIIHNVRSQGREEVCPERNFAVREKGRVLQRRTSSLFDAKKSRFFKICAFARTRGPIFRDFVRTSFMVGPIRSFYVHEQLKKAAYTTNFKDFFSEKTSFYFVISWDLL